MAIEEEHGYPVALYFESASLGEVNFVGATVETKIIPTLPKRIIGDKAYDSDGLDKELEEKHQIERLAPTDGRGEKSKTRGGCAVTSVAGKWKVSFHGCKLSPYLCPLRYAGIIFLWFSSLGL